MKSIIKKYKESRNDRPITYELAIDLDKEGRPFVLSERLRQRRKGQRWGQPYSFLILENGEGRVWKGNADGTQNEFLDLKRILMRKDKC